MRRIGLGARVDRDGRLGVADVFEIARGVSTSMDETFWMGLGLVQQLAKRATESDGEGADDALMLAFRALTAGVIAVGEHLLATSGSVGVDIRGALQYVEDVRDRFFTELRPGAADDIFNAVFADAAG